MALELQVDRQPVVEKAHYSFAICRPGSDVGVWYMSNQPDRLQQVFAYHQATKHQLQAYANGPGSLDWATQPDPFRRYAGARLIALEAIEPADQPLYDEVFSEQRMPAAAPGREAGERT